MIYQKLRKVGNSIVVTIPRGEIERLNLKPGQMVALQIQPVENHSVLSEELEQIVEESWQEHKEGYRYLAER